MISISVVKFGPDVEQKVLEVIRSGIIAQGPVVAELERGFAELVGVEHAVAVNSGTTALVASLQVLDLAPGDEVITSPFTFVATVNAILEAGATVRFADVTERDFNLDPATVSDQVTGRTRVLMPVHLYGQMADMDPLMELSANHGLHVVEDAAQALGARYGGRGAGSFGLGCFSLYATKNLTSGEGGMVTTNDAALADRLRVLRNQGMRARYQYEMAGHNYRLTDLQAAVAVPQLATYADQLTRRRANAARLVAQLSDIDGLLLPTEIPGREHVWHQFTVLVPTDRVADRDAMVDRLRDAGVIAGIYYPKPVYDYDCYRSNPQVVIGETPVAQDVARRCLSLPVHAHLTDDEVDQVAAAVRSVLA